MVVRHNTLRDVLAETCHRAHLGIQVEAGNDPTADHSHTHPADLIPLWKRECLQDLLPLPVKAESTGPMMQNAKNSAGCVFP